MNIVFVTAAVICILSAFSGYRKGFFKTAITMTSFLIAMVIVTVINPMVTKFVKQHTEIEQTVHDTIYDFLSGPDGYVPDREFFGDSDDNVLPKSWEKALEGLPLDQIKEQMGLEEIVERYVDYYSGIVTKSIAYVISVIIAYLLIRLGLGVAGIIGYIPVLSTLNRLAGLLLGLLRGVVLLWLIGLVVAMCSGYDWTTPILRMIKENPMLVFLYRNNLLAWLILPKMKGIL